MPEDDKYISTNCENVPYGTGMFRKGEAKFEEKKNCSETRKMQFVMT